jgi:Putative phage tail protein
MASPLYKINSQTPPLLDLTVSSSAYGSMIPFGYGVVPVGANIIWATDIIPNAFIDDGVITYVYTVSFAAAAGEGPGVITKIWGDSTVLYDATGTYVDYQGEWNSNIIYLVGAIVHYSVTNEYYQLYKQYWGLPSPRPDITGYWNVYNGIVGASGQQVFASPTLYSGTDTQGVDPTIEAQLGVGLTSAYRGLIYAVWDNLDLTSFGNKLPNIRMLVEFGSPASSPPVYNDSVDVIVTDICSRCGIDASSVDTTDLAGIATTAQLDSSDLPQLGIVTGSTMTFYQSSSGSGVGSPVEFNYPGNGRNRPLPASVRVYPLAPTETMLINPYSDDESNILPGWTRTDGNTIIPFVVAGVLTGDTGPATWDGTSTAPFNSAYQSDILTIWSAQISVQAAGTYTFQCIHMGGVIVGVGGGASRVSGSMVNVYDSAMTVTPSKGLPILYQNNYGFGNYPNDVDPPVPGSLTDTFEISFPAAGTYPIELDYGCHIHKRCCNLVWKMPTGDYSALVPQAGTAGANPVTAGSGFIVTGQKDGRSIIADLETAYFFNMAESDFMLKGVLQGANPSTITIPESDLGLVRDDKEITEIILQDQDQPQLVTVTFLDANIDFQQNSQLKARSSRVVTSLQQTTIDLTMSMSTAQARSIAERTLYTSWMSRQTYDFNLWKAYYCLLDAADVVEFVYESVVYQVRVVTSNIGQNFAVKINSVNQLPTAYASTVGSGPSGGGIIPTLITGPTTLFIFDLPYLADTDATSDQTQTGIYWAVASTDPTATGWGGGIFEQCPVGSSAYSTIGSSTVQPSYGTVVSGALGMPRAFETWDLENSIDIVMAQGTLTADTDLNVFNGANTLLIGSEVIQFTDCTSAMAGSPPVLTYTVSRLLRGRRNTDPFAIYHEANESAIVLGSGMNHNMFPLSFIAASDTYKGVTVGADASLVTPQSLTSQGNDSKCASPVHLTGSRDGSNDLQIGWIRRTRFGGDWLEGTDYVPLNEQTEAYEIDILYSDFFTRINTLAWAGTYDSNGLPYVVYTAAQQTADGLTPGAPVNVCIYQVSAITSRGFGLKGTI